METLNNNPVTNNSISQPASSLKIFLIISIILNIILFAAVGWLFKMADNANKNVLMLKAMDSSQADNGDISIKVPEVMEGPGGLVESDRLKTYVNESAKFSLKYPENLYVIEEDEKLFSDFRESETRESRMGALDLCTSPKEEVITSSGLINCSPNLHVFYVIPAVREAGETCEVEKKTKIEVNGKMEDACMDDKGLRALYPLHPEGVSNFVITAKFGEGLDKGTTLAILNSIKFFQ